MKIIKFYYIIFILLLIIFSGCNQEVSVSPPDALPPDGFIFIDSNPQGAQIYLNNKFTRRVTPDSIKFLATNSYNITLKKEYFRDTSFTANITEGVKSNVLVDYTKNPLMQGKINCTTIPDNSEIFLNGAATGLTTPTVLNNILPGQYVVSFYHTNHIDDSVSVIVRSNTTIAAKTTLVDTTVWNYYNTSNSPLLSNSITGIVIDLNNNIWIGTEDKGLYKFNGGTWTLYAPGNSIIQDSKVTSVAVNKDGTVWAGTQYGLFLAGIVYQKYNSKDWGNPLIDSNIKHILTDGNNRTYITASTAILKSYLTSNVYAPRTWDTLITISPIDPKHDIPGINLIELGITGLNFTALGIDNSNNYWIGTGQNGVIVIDAGIIRYNTSTTTEIGNNINEITVSPSGVVWIGYNWSLSAQSSISYYDNGTLKAPGVVPLNTNTNSIYIDQNDTKWVGTTAGLIVFNNVANTTVYNKETTGLDINDVRGVAKDSQGRVWIATHGGGLILKKK